MPRRAELTLVWLGLLVGFWRWGAFTADDAFITWRYGQTLVEHGLWNWNPVGARVEAYTNPAYALLSIIPALFGSWPLLWFKGLAAFVLLLLVRLIASVADARARLLLWLVLLAPVTQVHLWSGLETVSFALVVAVVSWRLLRGPQDGALVALLVLLPLLRPEGALLSVIGFFWLWPQRSLRPALLLAVLAGVVFIGLRLWWFGELVPNPFHLKATNPSLSALPGYLARVGWIALVPCVLIALYGRRAALVAAFPALLVLWYGLNADHLMMNYAERFIVHAALPALLLALMLLRRGVPLMVLGVSVLGYISLLHPLAQWPVSYLPRLLSAHGAMGAALAPLAVDAQGNRRALAVADAGILPMRADWRVIDAFGLADAHVAKHGLAGDWLDGQGLAAVVVINGPTDPAAPLFWARQAALQAFAQARGWQAQCPVVFNSDYQLVLWHDPTLAIDLRPICAQTVVNLSDELGKLALPVNGWGSFNPALWRRPDGEADHER